MYIALIGSIINLILNIYLIPKYELVGAAYATFISYFMILIISYLMSRNSFRNSFNPEFLLKTFTIIVIGMIIVTFLNDYIENKFIIIIISSLFYLISAYKYIFKFLKPYILKLYF